MSGSGARAIQLVRLRTEPGLRLSGWVEPAAVAAGDFCVIEGPRVVELARVTWVEGTRSYDPGLVQARVRVLRRATDEDRRVAAENHALARSSFRVCLQLIRQLGLPMKLSAGYYALDRSKAVFEFTADGRVDFRQLVRELAGRLRTRVELRQIGVRDESKQLGGIGVCGRRLCCASWINEFASINVRMAKDQQLSLSPSNVSGLCSRLKCCLRFEHDTYRALDQALPRKGACVRCAQGSGTIVERQVLRQTLTLRLADDRLIELPAAQVQASSERRQDGAGG